MNSTFPIGDFCTCKRCPCCGKLVARPTVPSIPAVPYVPTFPDPVYPMPGTGWPPFGPFIYWGNS